VHLHGYFQPVHIIVSRFLVIAEGFDTREILYAEALRVHQRLVDAKVVRIAVCVLDGLAKRNDLFQALLGGLNWEKARCYADPVRRSIGRL